MGPRTENASLTLGKRIARARERVGLTQLDLSKAMSLSPATVSRWERDAGEPTIGQLLDLARRFGVALEWLASGQTQLDLPSAGHSTGAETVPATFALFLTTPIGRLAVDHGLMSILQQLRTHRPPTVALYSALTVALVGAESEPESNSPTPTPTPSTNRREPRTG